MWFEDTVASGIRKNYAEFISASSNIKGDPETSLPGGRQVQGL